MAAPDQPPASPSARKLAEEHGLDLATVTATGPNGRITRGDVENAIAANPSNASATPMSAAAEPGPALSETDAGVSASPLAKRMAAEKGLDLATVKGSGPNGKIVKADIENYEPGSAPTPASAESGARASVAALSANALEAPYDEVPLNGVRKTIARRLTEAKQTIPHIYLTVDIKLDALLALRSQSNASLAATGGKVSKASARRDGDHYVLNGTKQFTSGAGVNDFYVTLVRTGEHKTRGITCLVIEKDTPGLSFGAPEKKLGWHASPTAQVIFEDARVPVENRIVEEGEGFRFAMGGLDGERQNIGACSLGGAQRCLDEAVSYAKDRQQFGQPIADFQNTQFMLADMATELEAARALLYLAAAKVTDNAPDKTRFSAMAKRLATDSGSNVVNNALQLFGG